MQSESHAALVGFRVLGFSSEKLAESQIPFEPRALGTRIAYISAMVVVAIIAVVVVVAAFWLALCTTAVVIVVVIQVFRPNYSGFSSTRFLRGPLPKQYGSVRLSDSKAGNSDPCANHRLSFESS